MLRKKTSAAWNRIGLAFLGFLFLSTWAGAQSVRDLYTKREVYITMRDGVRLFTSIYIPKDTSRPAPFLMMRTPYSCRPYGEDQYRSTLGPEPSFLNEGYIFVYQDVRGRYMSEGEFAWMRPYKPNKRPGEADETTDTYDTIEWLLRNIPNNNGRVGVYGTSYPGHYAAQTLIDPHPALVAVSPQAPMADNWLGDDMHHNGAFFLPHAMNFIAGFGKKRDGPTQDYGPRVFQHDTPDGYRFFLNMGPLKNSFTKYNMDQIPIWKEWMEHGDYDEYWQAQNVPQHLKKVGKVAVLTVGGWWDAEDLYGPLAIYRAIEANNPGTTNSLVMGPWYHGSWNGGPGTSLHDITWTTQTGVDFREKLQKPFFRYYLWGDIPKPDIPEVMMFDVGADRWLRADQWPPKEARPVSLYPRADGTLRWTPSSNASDYKEYLSDPNRPVPNSATITTGMARSYMIEDQRFVWTRPDVLSFETEPLTEPLTLAGPLQATLYVATTGTDADFIVKLIDVYPNDAPNNSPRGEDVVMGGYQMLIRGEPMRAKYRNSWSHPEPLKASRFHTQPEEVHIEKVEFVLPDVCYTFQPGHRVMIQIHSSWFPLIDRNPQTFTNIYTADESAFQKAFHRVYLGGQYASRIAVTVLDSAVGRSVRR
ncbi:MAG: CocE/NonD family hydrolase [Armatimonadetes bacterium]|nr:MAG: CocE/NonD family hydrolase [Armatimonadota bacterium]